MSSSKTGFNISRIQNVTITDDTLAVDLVDDRTISIPIGWYPRLEAGTAAERANWRLIGQGMAFTGPIAMKM